MDRVVRLPEAVANQIAAGEVVERPASVVKELVENALDAGARRIRVDVEQGGQDLVRVTDDGSGMTKNDAVTALLRHATSKIARAEDLERVRTLGFRGEALPSIASVARFRLTTRRPEDEVGTRVDVEGTSAPVVTEVGAAAGTTVEVRDLFFNVPARKKFMRRPSTEMGHVTETVVRLALAAPEVALRLQAAERTVIDAPPAGADPRGRLGRILGRATAERLVPIPPDDRPHAIEVTGFVSEPGLTERTSRSLYVFLNGRFVRDRGIQHAAAEPYRTLIDRGRYPVVILHVSLDPDLFDVNVHPQKTEVRFRTPQVIHRAVFGAVARTLDDALVRPAVPAPSAWSRTVEAATPPDRPAAAAHGSWARDAASGPIPMLVPRSPRPPASNPRPELELHRTPPRALGAVLGRYVVAEGDGRVLLVDARAVLQRQAYDRLERAGPDEAASQRLLVPRVVELGAAAAERARDLGGELIAVGFEVEEFGGDAVAIVAAPAGVAEADVEPLLVDLLNDAAAAGPDAARRRKERWARRTARAAVAEVPATPEGRAQLLDALDRDPRLRRGIDGRPTVVELSSAAVERLFEAGR